MGEAHAETGKRERARGTRWELERDGGWRGGVGWCREEAHIGTGKRRRVGEAHVGTGKRERVRCAH